MDKNNITQLGFSEPFLPTTIVENGDDHSVDNLSVVINLSDEEVQINNNEKLKPFNSSIYKNVKVRRANRIAVVPLTQIQIKEDWQEIQNHIKSSWRTAFDIFKLPNLRDTQLWRSKKHKLKDLELNYWFASEGTHCGLHNEHNFKELHTQLFGIGHMQKFYDDDPNSLYQDVHMIPGYTHDFFCDRLCNYPWHQYYAETDCIWLALEFA